eukprot:3011271-Rhodomonas_salina.3
MGELETVAAYAMTVPDIVPETVAAYAMGVPDMAYLKPRGAVHVRDSCAIRYLSTGHRVAGQ